jgi:hypothetical protein
VGLVSQTPDQGDNDMTDKLKAIAYAIADEVETRADAIRRRRPRLSYRQCQSLALLEMAK